MRRVGWIPIAALALLVAAGAVAQDEFSAEERDQLVSGELVRREVTRREGPFSYVGGTSYQYVRAPLDEVWRTVLDTDVYPRLIPSLQDAAVVQERDGERVVRMRHRYSIASAEYYARVRIEEDRHRVRFDLDRTRPHDLRAGRGYLTLSPYRDGTIVTWGALADLGSGMIQNVFGSVLNDWMLRVPRCVRDAVEPGRRSSC